MMTRALILAIAALAPAFVDHSSGGDRLASVQGDSLRVKIEARPASIRTRDTAAVTVTVTSMTGPVSNANLSLKASGGSFITHSQETTGVTNRSGVYTIQFYCGYQCVPIYTITAQATRTGMVSGQSTITIRGSR